MNYEIPIANYWINELRDHHAINGWHVLVEEEAAVALLLTNTVDTTEFPTSLVLFANPELDTATAKAWCTRAKNADDEWEYTVAATSPLGTPVVEGDSLTMVGYDDYDNEVYFVMEGNSDYIELVKQKQKTHVFIKETLLEKEVEQVQELTDIDAYSCIMELLEDKWDNLAKIYLTSGGDALDISGTPRDNDFTVELLDSSLKGKISNFSFYLKMLNPDGTDSTLPACTVVKNDEADPEAGCTVTVPASYTSGYANVKVYFAWTEVGSMTRKRVSTTVKLTDWDDPVIMVDSVETYDTLSLYGMMLSPAKTDPANFEGCKDLTDQQMSNAVALTVLKNKGYVKDNLPGGKSKSGFLKSMGLSDADANDLAGKFMTLSEAKAVTSTMLGSIFSNNTNITHFESLGYFVGLGKLPSNSFMKCANLRVVYLPLNLEIIDGNAFNQCASLEIIETLKD